MKYYLKKIITLIITLLLVSVLAFFAFRVISDPASAILGTSATPESLERLRHEMGLDRPLAVQYFSWLAGFVTGDLGTSYSYKMSVGSMVLQKLPVTMSIVLIAFLLMLVFSIPVGVLSARNAGGRLDRFLTVTGQIFMSVPAFLLGVALTYLFGIALKMFTPGAVVSFSDSPAGWFKCMLFPALAIAIPRTAMTARLLRGSILSQMEQNYVLTAYSRGESRRGVLMHHVLRNSMLSYITFMGASMAEIVANCIIVEQVFALPGIGVLLLSSIGNRDFPVVQVLVVLLAAWVITVNTAADILCRVADPRIRME